MKFYSVNKKFKLTAVLSYMKKGREYDIVITETKKSKNNRKNERKNKS